MTLLVGNEKMDFKVPRWQAVFLPISYLYNIPICFKKTATNCLKLTSVIMVNPMEIQNYIS